MRSLWILYAPAHAGLADAWAAAGLYGLTPPLEARARALPEAQRAVELEPDLGEAHTSLGHVLHNFDWDWGAAEREYTLAIELSPNLAVAHHWRARLLAQHGDFDAARAELRMARELDPLSVTIILAGGVVEYYAGRYDLALEYAQRAGEIDSTNALIHRLSAAVLDRQGHRREAIRELSRSFQLQGHPEVGAALVKAFDAGGVDGALQLLIAGLLRKRASGAYEPAEHLAELYSRLGRKDEALKWLEQGYQEHDTELNRLKVDLLLRSIAIGPTLPRPGPSRGARQARPTRLTSLTEPSPVRSLRTGGEPEPPWCSLSPPTVALLERGVLGPGIDFAARPRPRRCHSPTCDA